MKVVLVSQEAPPETAWGGIGTYVDVLSSAMAEKGIDVHVLSVVEGQRAGTRREGGVTTHRLPLARVRGPGRIAPESWRRLWLPFTVAQQLRKLAVGASLVECPEWNAEGLALGLRGALPLAVRLHSSARQLFTFTGQGRACLGLDGRTAMWLEEVSARLANVVISTASNLDEMAGRIRLEPGAVHSIPYPVRLPRPTPLDDHSPPRVTFVGRLEPRKGPEVVLRAAAPVLAAVPETRFAFIGRDGVEPGSLSSSRWLAEEAERIGIAHAVELPGQLDREQLSEELRRATVCAFPSRWESFGNVVAEASASGRPVVVSSIPPFRELVEDGVTGRIVPSEDKEAWAAALVEILKSRDRARAMGEAGTARIAKLSAPEGVADLTLTAYEHAVDRWRRGQRAGRGLPISP